MFKNPLIFLWIIAVLIIVPLRFLQLCGIFISIKDKPLKGYYLILLSILLLILINGVGLGNPSIDLIVSQYLLFLPLQ